MAYRNNGWKFLWLEYSRVGYVEHLTLFGYTLYRRAGSVINILGFEWIEEQR